MTPKTIADLKINWTFDYNFEDSVSEKIHNDNLTIADLRIVPNEYYFTIDDDFTFKIPELLDSNFTSLLREIDYKIFKLQLDNKLPRVLILDRFEVISKNIFKIHVKE
jgi:hypothetical protein